MNEQALKERIRYIANLEGRVFNQVWRSLILERLLVRLSLSPYKNQFIFKGGGSLLSHYIKLDRETKDVDFLLRESNVEMVRIEKSFQEICDLDAGDGFLYNLHKIEPLRLEAASQFCYRLTFNLKFGKMKDRIQVDVAGGDVVEAKAKSLKLYQYKGKPLFEKSISLRVYPVETIFAEKLESIVSRADANTRMKDYHDLILLCRSKGIINFSKLKKDISKIFAIRGEKKLIPLQLSNKEINTLQQLWVKHRVHLHGDAKSLKLPAHIKEVITEINNWLLRHKAI